MYEMCARIWFGADLSGRSGPDKVSADIGDRSDEIMGALNLLRYLLLVDVVRQ